MWPVLCTGGRCGEWRRPCDDLPLTRPAPGVCHQWQAVACCPPHGGHFELSHAPLLCVCPPSPPPPRPDVLQTSWSPPRIWVEADLSDTCQRPIRPAQCLQVVVHGLAHAAHAPARPHSMRCDLRRPLALEWLSASLGPPPQAQPRRCTPVTPPSGLRHHTKPFETATRLLRGLCHDAQLRALRIGLPRRLGVNSIGDRRVGHLKRVERQGDVAVVANDRDELDHPLLACGRWRAKGMGVWGGMGRGWSGMGGGWRAWNVGWQGREVGWRV